MKRILKINMPFNDESIYVEVEDENKPVKEILEEVIKYLESNGRFYQAQQLKAYVFELNCDVIQVVQNQENVSDINSKSCHADTNYVTPQQQQDTIRYRFRIK